MEPRREQEAKKKALLLGLGLDNEDGHTRVTTGENFALLGGSEETHGQMQEKAIRFNEELSRRKKRLEDVSPQEFLDIAGDARMIE